MKIDPAFKIFLSNLDLAKLEASPDVIYFLDKQLVLRGFNKAWADFMNENHGHSPDGYLGTPILNVIPEEIRPFYAGSYGKALASRTRFDHDFQCSSPEAFRVFHQTAYPLTSGGGLMIVNTLVKTEPHSDKPLPLGPCHFKQGTEIISMCTHCRKVRDQDFPEKWDWVPAAFSYPPMKVSHGLCEACKRFYYPDLFTG